METVKVQQFYEADDKFYELGDIKDIELSDSEREDAENGIAWIDRLNGFFGIPDNN